MLSKFSVANASWKGVTVANAIAELHTAVVDNGICDFQVRWFSEVDGVQIEIRNAVVTIDFDIEQPFISQLETAFLVDFPQAIKI